MSAVAKPPMFACPTSTTYILCLRFSVFSVSVWVCISLDIHPLAEILGKTDITRVRARDFRGKVRGKARKRGKTKKEDLLRSFHQVQRSSIYR